ncbi:MAG: polysaccharide biosynthesis tyrosine autokinase [Flavobacteriales bacterium]
MKNNSSYSEDIDFVELIKNYSRYWYFFILSILILIFIGYLYSRYSSKVYSASTTILIKDENNTTIGSDNIIDGIDLFGKNRNIKNEIGILKSFSLVKKTLKEASYNISYLNEGKVISFDIYDKSPFTLELDSNHIQSIGNKFFVTLLSKDEFIIKSKIKSKSLYDLKKETYIRHPDINFNFEKKYSFNQWIENDYFKFKLRKNDFTFYDEESWKNYSFVLNDLNLLSEKILKRINIKEIDKDASILKITLEGNNTKKIKNFLDRYAVNYLNIGLNEKNAIASNTIKFINKQLIDIRDSLTNVESSLELFKKNNPKIELSKKEYGAFYQIQKLEEEQAILKLNNKYYYSLKDYLIKNDNIDNVLAPSAMGINDPLLNNLIIELSKLYSELQILSQNTKEIHPAIKSLRSQIKSTKSKIIENIENIISSSELSLNDINARIGEFDKLISSLPKSERKLVSIERKFSLNETTYTYLLEKRAEASIAKAGNVADNKIVDKARLTSVEPIRPNRKTVYITCLFIGILIPGLIITIINLLNDKISSKSDVLKISNIPVIGSIPNNLKETNLVVINNPKSIISEAFRSIRTNIQYLASEKNQKVICISSSISGEGKSFCSVNIASILSTTGNKTLLIGADMRKPKIYDGLNLSTEKGLSSFLISNNSLDEIIQKTNNENLDIIVSGAIPPNPAELLEKDKMDKLINEVKNNYNFIVIDTPPIGLVTDAQILMNKSDINLILIRQDYTAKSMVVNIEDIINKSNINNVSFILNDVKYKKNNYGYGYGYGYGYYEEDNKQNNPWWKINKT